MLPARFVEIRFGLSRRQGTEVLVEVALESAVVKLPLSICVPPEKSFEERMGRKYEHGPAIETGVQMTQTPVDLFNLLFFAGPFTIWWIADDTPEFFVGNERVAEAAGNSNIASTKSHTPLISNRSKVSAMEWFK